MNHFDFTLLSTRHSHQQKTTLSPQLQLSLSLFLSLLIKIRYHNCTVGGIFFVVVYFFYKIKLFTKKIYFYNTCCRGPFFSPSF